MKQLSFYLDNPEERDKLNVIRLFEEGVVSYLFFQKELINRDTIRLHGLCLLNNPTDLGDMFSKFEIATGSPQTNITLLNKQKNIVAGPWEYGSIESTEDPWGDGAWLDNFNCQDIFLDELCMDDLNSQDMLTDELCIDEMLDFLE